MVKEVSMFYYIFCPLSGYSNNIRSKVKRACEYVMTGKYLSKLKKKNSTVYLTIIKKRDQQEMV